jgi:hypothetical protein
MIIKFGFTCNNPIYKVEVNSKLTELKSKIEDKFEKITFIQENNSHTFFSTEFNVGIFGIPDSAEIEVKKIIEDFIKENDYRFKFS